MENATTTPQVLKSHIYRFSDSYQYWCGAERQPFVKGAVYVDCEDCKAAKAAKRASQAQAAKRVIAAQAARESAFGDFEIYD